MIAIVESVCAAIVGMLAVAKRSAHPAERAGSLEQDERHVRAMGVKCGTQTCGTAAENGQLIHSIATGSEPTLTPQPTFVSSIRGTLWCGLEAMSADGSLQYALRAKGPI